MCEDREEGLESCLGPRRQTSAQHPATPPAQQKSHQRTHVGTCDVGTTKALTVGLPRTLSFGQWTTHVPSVQPPVSHQHREPPNPVCLRGGGSPVFYSVFRNRYIFTPFPRFSHISEQSSGERPVNGIPGHTGCTVDDRAPVAHAQRHRTRPRHGGGGACPYPDTLRPHTGSLSRHRSHAARPERQRTTVDCHRIVQKGASTHRSHRLSSVPSPSHAVSGALEYSPPSASHQDTLAPAVTLASLQGSQEWSPGG